MDLPDKFKFEVVGGEFPVYYANKLNSTVYEISWEDNYQVKSCTYTIPSVESRIETGGWKIIKEEENMTTKLKPFNLEKALAGEKVVTRDGRNVVEVVKLNKVMGDCNIVGVTEEGIWYTYTSDGCYWTQGDVSDNDLFMAPTKKQGWVGVYKPRWPEELARCNEVYATKEEAIEKQYGGLIDIVMIEWEE